ncbi:MAG: hypothetical protein QMB16_03180 [Paracoccaceae bacterium]
MGPQAKGFRLQQGDVLVAINGNIFQGDSTFLSKYFLEAIDAAEEDELPDPTWLLTFYRDGVFINLLFSMPLTAKFDFCEVETAVKITEGFKKLSFAPLKAYENYEVFRDMDHVCTLYSTTLDPIATYVPAIWMLQNKLFYPLAAILIIYGMTFLASPFMFGLAYILVSLYTKNAQLNLQRSYQLFSEKFFWVVVGAESDLIAKETCYQLDNDARFAFGQNPYTKKKKKKGSNAGKGK